MANAKHSLYDLHCKSTVIFTLWAADILDELEKSKNLPSAILSSVEEGRVWLENWAEIARRKTSGTNSNPSFNEYAKLVNHCEWRKRHIKSLSQKRGTAETLIEEVTLITSWIILNVGGNYA